MKEVDLVAAISWIAERGVIDLRLRYRSPFSDLDAMRIEGVFDTANVVEIIGILEQFRQRS